MIITDTVALKASQYLVRVDPVLAPIIATSGPCPLRPHANYYQELVQSIIGQQLSLKAAASIEGRLVALNEGTFPDPTQILAFDDDQLRSVGFSRPKVSYIKDLASHVLDEKLQLGRYESMSNQEIIDDLTAVKGIGVWTVHMFLMFCMARSDVLAVGDLGIKNGVRNLYGLSSSPTPEEIERLAKANRWHPYETIACWYVWRSLEMQAAQRPQAP